MTYIIAEIGINHNGSLDIAKKLIDMAVDCRVDAVKFQKRNPLVCVPFQRRHTPVDTPWGTMTYLEYKQKIEFGQAEYEAINDYCNSRCITWFASAWDFDSLHFLRQFDLPVNKIPSALATYWPFVEEVAKEKKVTLISTGMCTNQDISSIVEIFRKYNCLFALNHCVSTYPAAPEDLNLSVIPVLKKAYGCEVGYSGHETGVLPSVVAALLGASFIERHITLDRAMFGTDQAASLERRGLEILVRDIRSLPTIMGDGEKKILPSEKEVEKKLRYWL